MLPLVNIAHIPVTPPPSLVDTAIPGNTAQRVPYDNVAPPVSSPRTEPDARGNPQFFSPGSQTPLLLPETTAATPGARGFAGTPFGTPATLIAQLIGQPVPDQTSRQLQTILQEYEKLISNSQIKYKPSDATKPQAEPTGVFGRLLAQNNNAPAVRRAPASAAPPSISPAQTTQVRSVAAPTRASSRGNNDVQTAAVSIENEGANIQASIRPVQAISAQVIRSYQESLARNQAEEISA